MEKLIELLNEYDPYIQSDGTHTDNFWWYVSQGHSAVFPKEVGIERIISKQYGFIKWLVNNDKIDFENQAMQYAKEDLSKFLNERKDKNGMSDEYAMILMLLATQDEPIEFLISILR